MSSTTQFGVVDVETLKSMSGLAFLEAMRDEVLPGPPMAKTLGFRLTQIEHGKARFEGMPTVEHYNPLGTVHGGWTSTVLDSCMACAVQSTLAPGQAFTTLDLNVNFIRAVTVESGLVFAVGECIHSGRRSATAEGRLVGRSGKLYAHATTTCLVFSPKGE